VFEIGTSLREARRQRGLDLEAAQRALRIRRRYLEALEAERFDQLPGDVYARGFLREYADFLGLESSLYLQEYDERFRGAADIPIAPVSVVRRRRRPTARAAVIGAVALVAMAAGLAAWRLNGSSENQQPAPPAAAPVVRKHAFKPPAAKAQRAPHVAHLVFRATRGDCWLAIRLRSATGQRLYENTLRAGGTLRLTFRHPLWIRFGAGGNLDATVNGKPLRQLPRVTGNLLVRVPA
jgi:hypothetical protein